MEPVHGRNIAMTDYTGTRIGNYRILHLLGSGGMGAVYLGEHVLIGKRVAIKFLHAKFANNKAHQSLFLREARAAVAVGHRNVVDIQDIGVSLLNEPYIVMEYLEGESTAELLAREGTLDLRAACAILVPVLCALSAAHKKGIIHRDLKPDNILLSYRKGAAFEVKLIDFGVSKMVDNEDNSGLLQQGKTSGTLAYMPPEQMLGRETMDGRSDLFAVGVILYEMLTGRLPFCGTSPSSYMAGVLSQRPLPLLLDVDALPACIEPLVMQLLSKKPTDRPANARVVLRHLVPFCDMKFERWVGKGTSSNFSWDQRDCTEAVNEQRQAYRDASAQTEVDDELESCTLLYAIRRPSAVSKRIGDGVRGNV